MENTVVYQENKPNTKDLALEFARVIGYVKPEFCGLNPVVKESALNAVGCPLPYKDFLYKNTDDVLRLASGWCKGNIENFHSILFEYESPSDYRVWIRYLEFGHTIEVSSFQEQYAESLPQAIMQAVVKAILGGE